MSFLSHISIQKKEIEGCFIMDVKVIISKYPRSDGLFSIKK